MQRSRKQLPGPNYKLNLKQNELFPQLLLHSAAKQMIDQIRKTKVVTCSPKVRKQFCRRPKLQNDLLFGQCIKIEEN